MVPMPPTRINYWTGFASIEKLLILWVIPAVQRLIETQLTFHSGDSYTDSGFTVKGRLPSSDWPLGNPEVDFSRDSRITWPVYLTTKYNDSAFETYILLKPDPQSTTPFYLMAIVSLSKWARILCRNGATTTATTVCP